ncbi:MAG: TetR/AcrR family transcriptional regulator [Methanobacterium sp.]
MSKSENSKYRILKAARKVFADKGYDGARVDEIAREAGINKAMLYYYFNSKENILREVIMNISLTYKEDENNQFNISDLMGEDKEINDEIQESTLDDALQSIKDNEQIFRIILTEFLKNTPSEIVGFNVLDNILIRTLDDVKASGLIVEDNTEFMMKQLFFVIIPMFTFIALRDDWSEYYKINPEDLNKIFKKIMKHLTLI